jgi:hypothetical protein
VFICRAENVEGKGREDGEKDITTFPDECNDNVSSSSALGEKRLTHGSSSNPSSRLPKQQSARMNSWSSQAMPIQTSASHRRQQ